MQIVTERLFKRFGDLCAVNDLNVTIESGTLVALLGPSGCGKSTLLNMISGILPVSSGTIRFDDKNVTTLPPEKRNVGLVFQNYALYPHMTVLDNICFPLVIKKIKKRERLAKAKELAELVHIDTLLKRKPSELSGGQQQRVAIARALAKQPDILLLDEPLSNLDAKLRVEMREEIRRIQRDTKVTTIFVTHDQEEASSIADQVILLDQGILQQYGSPHELYNNPVNAFTADFLGAPSINRLGGVRVGDGICLRDSDIMIPLALPASVAPGRPITLAVRAESVRTGRTGQDQLFEALVLERYALGKDELALFAVGGQQMRGYVDSELALEPGDRLPLSLAKKGVFCFDTETGERYL